MYTFLSLSMEYQFIVRKDRKTKRIWLCSFTNFSVEKTSLLAIKKKIDFIERQMV